MLNQDVSMRKSGESSYNLLTQCKIGTKHCQRNQES